MCDLDIMEKNQRLGSHMLARIIANPDTCGHACLVAQSCPTLCNYWTIARQAPLSMGLFRQEYWSGLPFPSLGDLPDPGREPVSPVSLALWADSLPAEPSGKSHPDT